MDALNRMEVSIKHTGLKLDRMASELLEKHQNVRSSKSPGEAYVEKIKENDQEAEHARTEAIYWFSWGRRAE